MNTRDWVYDEELRANFSMISDKESHTVVAGIPNDFSITNEQSDLDRQRADACLIISAPIMLNALKDALCELEYLAEHTSIKTECGGDYIDIDPVVLQNIRVAIAMANKTAIS